ncbi:MAG TPA: hypothetical protein VM682_03135, partial [Bacillus sp. (in: firmicutes)]|nr:hypothetical protein [Bacillus sp. (in: firmicutes)]
KKTFHSISLVNRQVYPQVMKSFNNLINSFMERCLVVRLIFQILTIMLYIILRPNTIYYEYHHLSRKGSEVKVDGGLT